MHSIGGAISLIGAIALGPRLGRVFKRDGGGPPLPHNIILGAVGGLILWFGWYGFNPGSTLSAMDMQGIARVSFNTTMAACSAGLAALFYAYVRVGKWDLGLTTNGFLAGLVAITCPCYWVSPTGAFFIGIVAGVVVIWATDALEYRAHRRSDRRGAGAPGLRHLGHAVARAVRHRRVRPADADRRGRVRDRQGPVLRRRHGAADGAGDRQRRGRARHARRRRSC